MKKEYEYNDNAQRGYAGIYFSEEESKNHLKNEVKDILLDIPERNKMREELKSIIEESGFGVNEVLLLDLQALESNDVNVSKFRIGEAYAEVILEKEFSCRFYWNEMRDSRNPKGNKPGADLVGFIKIDNDILFLFGEVKTSSENRNPPQVMTAKYGLENQLLDLYNNREKRRILITYLTNKVRLYPDNHPFKKDWRKGIESYYLGDNRYQLVGVLVRDTSPNESDVSKSYLKLEKNILQPVGLKLMALYIPLKQKDWLKIINSGVLS